MTGVSNTKVVSWKCTRFPGSALHPEAAKKYHMRAPISVTGLHFALWVLVATCCGSPHGSRLAADTALEGRPRGARRHVRNEATRPEQVVGAGGTPLVAAPGTGERIRAPELLRSLWPGDGGGAEVSGLTVVQTLFRDSNCEFPETCDRSCNTVLLLWVENSPEPEGIEILVDGQLLGKVSGLPSDDVPGINAANVVNLSADKHTFRIRSSTNASFAEATMTVLDGQPFSDPEVTCQEGNADREGTCQILVTLENQRVPTGYLLSIDGGVPTRVAGTTSGLVVGGQPPGEHCVALQGVMEAEGGTYLGCRVEACCNLRCQGGAYLPGACDGQDITIASAVFLLNYLFLGGPRPPCLAACDPSGDGSMTIADASYLLNFLFLGGSPPRGWPENQPTCVAVREGDDCEVPTPACEGE